MDKSKLRAALAEIEAAADRRQLQELRVKYLGRKGEITKLLTAIGQLPVTKRAAAGAAANAARAQIEQALTTADQQLRGQVLEQAAAVKLDLTVPVPSNLGHRHPVNMLVDELIQMFWQLGFNVVDGPEIETEWYNFESLLIKSDHPARDMQDTFYLEGAHLPRTHTSGVQVRYMEKHQPPIRIIAPGKVYRNEDEDPRHLWMFHQVEGLVVDENITMADLKGTLQEMIVGLLGANTKIRLRPSYFPYTEPSVEMDATCIICNGKGCHTCSGTGWIELGGAGMVHPDVLRNAGIDPARYSGFAFGFGPERIAAIKYQIPDIRYFWRPDLKFLEQF